MSDPDFLIHALGPWDSQQVLVRCTGPRLVLPAALEPAIAAAWQAAMRPGVHLFDGPLSRLDAWRVIDHTLHLDLGITSYRDFIGTNAAHPEWIEQHGRAVMADPLGTSAALLTCDGYLVFGIRSPHLALYPGCAHPFGGTCEPGNVDIIGELQRELAEELHLDVHDYEPPRILALTEDLTLRQPELVFVVRTHHDRATLAARLDASEHGSLWTVPANIAAVNTALAQTSAMTPVTRALLTAWQSST